MIYILRTKRTKIIDPFTVAQSFLGNQGKQMRGKAKREPD